MGGCLLRAIIPSCPKENIIGGAFKMKRERFLFSVALLSFTLLALLAVATSSADNKLGPYQQIATIPNAGLASFDISWVDSATETYYVADRSGASVDVIDAEHDTPVTSIPGFVGDHGHGLSGPNGVVVINKRGELGAGEGHRRKELWAGDGDSTVKVIDLETNSVVDSIPTGGVKRADELAYDPVDKIILIANDVDDTPFVTFISAETRTVLGHIFFNGVGSNPQATMGLEQPVWDSQRHRFYMTRVFAITDPNFAGPAGLALLPGQRLITSTGVVFDARTGATLANIAGIAGDEIWYNHGDNRVYFGNEPVFVVDASTYNIVASFDAGDTHSIAADSENNHIFVPITSVGVKVYTDDEDQEGRPDK
jgi:hypothetical protein